MATSTEKRVVSLTLDAKQFASQIKGLRDQLTGVRTAAQGTQKSLQDISSTLGLVSKATAAAYAIMRITDFVGAIQDANNVLRSVTESTEEFTSVQTELFEIANSTGAAIGQTTQAYARVARALQGTGRSSEDALRITERLNKALLVSGASAGEAASTLTQFSQALQSGKLQGDEFRSLTENAPLVINAIAQVSGQGRDALKQLAKEGKLTADVLVEALAGDAGKAIDEAAQGFRKTIPQAINIFQNKVIELITTNQTAVQSLSLVAEAIILVANNLVAATTVLTVFLARAQITGAITAMSTALRALAASTGLAATGARSMIVAFGGTVPVAAAAATSVDSVTASAIRLRTALIRTGIGALVVGLGFLIQHLTEVASESNSAEEAIKKFGQSVLDAVKHVGLFFLAMDRAILEMTNFFGLQNEAIATLDQYIIALDKSANAAGLEAQATRDAAAAKEQLAASAAKASAAIRELNRDVFDSYKNETIKTNQLLEQAEAYKKGGQAALDRLKIEQQVQDKYLETQEKYRVAGQDPAQSDVQANLEAQALRRRLEAEAALDRVTAKPAKAPKEKREKEYETLAQILADIKLKSQDAAGALAAFEAGGEAALTAFNNALERRNTIQQKLDEFEKNKIKLTPAQLEAQKQELDMLLKKQQLDELQLQVKQKQQEQTIAINDAERDRAVLQEGLNRLLGQGVQAYEDYIDAQNDLRAAEQAITPIVGETTEAYKARLQAMLALIEANRKLAKETATQQQKMQEATKKYADVFGRFIDDVVSGSVKFKDAIKSMLKELLILILKQIIFNALARSSNSFWSGVGTAGGGTKSAMATPAGGTKSAAYTTTAAAAQVGAYGTKVAPTGARGVQIVVNNNAPGVEVQARTRSDGEIIELAVQKMAGMVRKGGNAVSGAIENTYGVARSAGAY